MSNLTKSIPADERKMLKKAFWRSFTLYAAVSPAKQGASGFCYALMPFINKFYKNDEEGKKEALVRSMSYFNTTITCSTFSGKAVCRLVWDMNKAESDAYLEKALSGIPENFSGRLLEVPVGTGILTMPVYQTMPEADITCLDYSADMMGQAQEKAEHLRLKNVAFRQGDVGALPYADDTFDIVLSLNGFHAFPDKETAYREVFRVLKPGGTFCGCFYVRGEHKRTDWFVRHIYEKTGFFTPPYETTASLKKRLEKRYAAVTLGTVKSMVWFVCRKGNQ